MDDRRFRIPASWVFGAVALTCLGTVAWLLREHTHNPRDLYLPLSRVLVTSVTGVWFYIRQRYTERRAAPAPGALSVLIFYVTALVGLSCFIASDSIWWFTPHAVALLLATLRDFEIINFQTQRSRSPDISKVLRANARLIASHHWYSVLRDVSMAAWWINYGIVSVSTPKQELPLFWLYAGPYAVLVVGWMVIKDSIDKAEDELEAGAQDNLANR